MAEAHLVGRMDPDDAESVFRLVAERSEPTIRRIPDGEAGAERSIVATARHIRGFGVATGCGMGNKPRGSLCDLLRIRRAVTVPA